MMELRINQSHDLIGKGYMIGVNNENNSGQIIIGIDYDVLLTKWPYLEFELEDGTKYVSSRLNIADNKITYDIPSSLLQGNFVRLQVVFKDADSYIWRSNIKQLKVNPAINASDDLPTEYPDFISEAQTILDEAQAAATSITEVESHEVDRQAAEATRQANEVTRGNNETNRGNAETLRVTAEGTRSSQEVTRQANEVTRQNNEVARTGAETERQTEFDSWRTNIGSLDTYDFRLINLEEAAVGSILEYQEDTTTAFNKSVPTGALPYAKINKVGGMTYKSKNLFDQDLFNQISNPSINYSNGVITINSYFTNAGVCEQYFGALKGKTVKAIYTYVGNNTPGGASGQIRLYNPNGSIILTNGAIVTIPNDLTQYSLIFYGVENETVEFSEFMFTEDTTLTSYEPYFVGFRDTPVTSIVSGSTLPVNAAIQALDGYGKGVNDNAYNYIDYERKVFVKRVAMVDLGTLDWSYSQSIDFTTTGLDTLAKIPNDYSAPANIICVKYTTVIYTSSKIDKTIMLRTIAGETRRLVIRDFDYTDAALFKQAMSGVYLLYELATPVEIDISEYIDNNYIRVDGSVTFTNANNNEVPNKITYSVKI